ncbi:MAG: DUF4199 domain-containing protein [Alloprevotella sp.]|nr:DUF4199 domain-containing protein [Alloprevotella sp.]
MASSQDYNAFQQTNAYAMQNGLWLGLWGWLSLVAFRYSFSSALCSNLLMLMTLAGPVLGVVLTGRFRRSVAGADGAFTFGRGFTHTLFMGFYASIWVAVGIFVYLRYFDNGAIFSDYAAALSRPELQQALQESGLLEQLNAASGEGGLEGLPDALRSVGPAGYAAASLYMAMFATPLIALFAGAVCRRKGKR